MVGVFDKNLPIYRPLSRVWVLQGYKILTQTPTPLYPTPLYPTPDNP